MAQGGYPGGFQGQCSSGIDSSRPLQADTKYRPIRWCIGASSTSTRIRHAKHGHGASSTHGNACIPAQPDAGTTVWRYATTTASTYGLCTYGRHARGSTWISSSSRWNAYGLSASSDGCASNGNVWRTTGDDDAPARATSRFYDRCQRRTSAVGNGENGSCILPFTNHSRRDRNASISGRLSLPWSAEGRLLKRKNASSDGSGLDPPQASSKNDRR